MNLFSIIAASTAASMLTLIINRILTTKMDRMNVYGVTEIAIFIWWCFCDAFFYGAPTKEIAWIWHRLTMMSAIGFVIGATNYYFVMTDFYKKVPIFIRVIYFAIPVFLTARFLIGGPTPFADDLVQSKSGFGWTFVKDWTSLWPVVYTVYGSVYFGVALVTLARWFKNARHRMIKKHSQGLFRLVIFSVCFGMFSVYVVPLGAYLPPIPCVPLYTFGMVYWSVLRKYDFSYIQETLDNGYIYENCIGPMIVTDDTYVVLYTNNAAKTLCGDDEAVGKNVSTLFRSGSEVSFSAHDRELELDNGTPVICSSYRTKSMDKDHDLFVYYISDISELKNATNKLEFLANYDELTGLSNRRMVMNHLAEMEKAYKETGLDFELVFLDLTKFKYINDNFGHDAGDDALRAVAEVLKKNTPQSDMAARFAGDEFLVVHVGTDNKEIIESLREAVCSIDTSNFAPGFNMNAGIGVCKYSEVQDIEELLKVADERMYKDK